MASSVYGIEAYCQDPQAICCGKDCGQPAAYYVRKEGKLLPICPACAKRIGATNLVEISIAAVNAMHQKPKAFSV